MDNYITTLYYSIKKDIPAPLKKSFLRRLPKQNSVLRSSRAGLTFYCSSGCMVATITFDGTRTMDHACSAGNDASSARDTARSAGNNAGSAGEYASADG